MARAVLALSENYFAGLEVRLLSEFLPTTTYDRDGCRVVRSITNPEPGEPLAC